MLEAPLAAITAAFLSPAPDPQSDWGPGFDWALNHSSVALAVFLGPIVSWMVNFHPNLKSLGFLLGLLGSIHSPTSRANVFSGTFSDEFVQ